MTKRISAFCSAFLWWNELISIPFGIALYLISPQLILAFEPYAAVYSAGTLQKLLFGLITVFIGNGLAWLGLKLALNVLFNYKNDEAEQSFKMLNPYQKWQLLSFWFALYFLGFILSVQAL